MVSHNKSCNAERIVILISQVVEALEHPRGNHVLEKIVELGDSWDVITTTGPIIKKLWDHIGPTTKYNRIALVKIVKAVDRLVRLGIRPLLDLALVRMLASAKPVLLMQAHYRSSIPSLCAPGFTCTTCKSLQKEAMVNNDTDTSTSLDQFWPTSRTLKLDPFNVTGFPGSDCWPVCRIQ